MIRIAFLIDMFSAFGGAEKHLFELVRRLPPDMYQKEIYTFHGGISVARQLEGMGIPINIVPIQGLYTKSGLRGMWRLAMRLRNRKTDILQTCHFTSDLVGSLIKELSGVKYLVSNRRDMGFLKTGFQKRTYRWISPRCDKVVSVSRAVGKYLVETESCKEEQIEVIHNGVEIPCLDQQEPASFRLSLGVPPSKILIGSVANLKPEKRPDYTLEAVCLAVRDLPDARYVSVGEECGITYKEMMAIAYRFGIQDRVVFTTVESAKDIMGALDIFVLGSKSEGMSNSLLEAMSAGVPSVVTDVGGNPETIREGIDGYLIPQDDVRTYAARIRELVKDPSMRRTMGESARKRVQDEFTFDHMVSRFDRIYTRSVKAE